MIMAGFPRDSGWYQRAPSERQCFVTYVDEVIGRRHFHFIFLAFKRTTSPRQRSLTVPRKDLTTPISTSASSKDTRTSLTHF